jgi:hypothetical protein
MGDIFISYNRGSLEAVKALAQDLGAATHEVWFDQQLTGGQRWWDSILARIRACDIFVFALTADSLDSEACGRELDYALHLRKPVLPVLLSDAVKTAHLPAAIAPIQFVDYCKQDKQAAFALVRAIAALDPAPPLPDPLPAPPPVPISYVVSLKEKIDNPAPLDYREQIALVIELRDRYRGGRPVDEVAPLLERLKRRDDLLAKVGREIDTVLAEIASGRGPAPQEPAPEEPAKAPAAVLERQAPEPAAAERKAPEPVAGPADAVEQLVRRDGAVDECARLIRRVVERGERWRFEIDDLNHFVLERSDAPEKCLKATASLRDGVTGSRYKELKALGWTINVDGLAKGATGATALYLTGGVAAFALLSKTVRDYLMSFDATRTWPLPRDAATLAGAAAELALALQRVAPEGKPLIARPVATEAAA